MAYYSPSRNGHYYEAGQNGGELFAREGMSQYVSVDLAETGYKPPQQSPSQDCAGGPYYGIYPPQYDGQGWAPSEGAGGCKPPYITESVLGLNSEESPFKPVITEEELLTVTTPPPYNGNKQQAKSIQEFLQAHIGRMVRLEYAMGGSTVEKIGYIREVGDAYVLMDMADSTGLVMGELSSVKFVTVLANKTPEAKNYWGR